MDVTKNEDAKASSFQEWYLPQVTGFAFKDCVHAGNATHCTSNSTDGNINHSRKY